MQNKLRKVKSYQTWRCCADVEHETDQRGELVVDLILMFC